MVRSHVIEQKKLLTLVNEAEVRPCGFNRGFSFKKIKIMEEIWKDVVGYEGRYLISNKGKLKSIIKNKEVLINGHLDSKGYLQYTLSWKLKNKINCYRAHQLVAQSFLEHKVCGYKLVVDHINDNKLDNRVENLQIVTQRFNICKIQGNYSSQYKGVSWDKNAKKWRPRIFINGKNKNLGCFNDEYEAHLAYQNALKNIEL